MNLGLLRECFGSVERSATQHPFGRLIRLRLIKPCFYTHLARLNRG